MSHYDEQLEQLEAEDAAKRSAFEAQRDHFLNRAINEATPISIRDLLAGMVAAAERIADAVETLVAARPEVAMAGDHGDAPITLTPQSLEALYAESSTGLSVGDREKLIKAIASISWFGCTHRMDPINDELVMSVTRDDVRFDQLAAMLEMHPIELQMRLQDFDGFTKHPNHYSIRFPAAWVRAA